MSNFEQQGARRADGARREMAHNRAEQLVLEGVASGEPIVADEAFWARLRLELNSRIRLPKTE
jgi:hypothetical protein